jgi:ubiquitin carboxyl-terminal hydrolase 25/28
MITSPHPSVRPEQELARLTLISSTNEAAIRRRSTISGKRPAGLGEVNGLPIMGPLGPPQTTETDESNTEANHLTSNAPEKEHASKEIMASDLESEATLTSDTAQPGSQEPEADNKENEPPSPGDKTASATDADHLSSSNDQTSTNSTNPVEPPNRPPPVPPRPSESERQKQLIEEVELGAQQDVTEVINNVLFQSECAIKPRGIAPDGEQLDQIKE